MGLDSGDVENLAQAVRRIEGAVRDALMDYGGTPNVVDGLNNVAKAIGKLADAGFEIVKAINSLKNS